MQTPSSRYLYNISILRTWQLLLYNFLTLQAGCGRFQLIAALIAGLGLSGHAIQVYSVFYILPSAEVEFCILGGEKNWLGNITLVGLGVGSLIWGGLAGRSGRRKTLLSCLGVSAVFSGKYLQIYANHFRRQVKATPIYSFYIQKLLNL